MPIPRITSRGLFAGGVVVVLAGASVAFVVPGVLRHSAGAPVGARAASAPASEPAASAMVPSRLKIPAIGVDSRVESVGVTPAGTMGVPNDIHDVGWYALGVRPGQAGDAVFDGHLTWTSGPAVFAKLNQLKAGDLIEVVYSDGSSRQFKVVKTTSYAWNDRPSQLFATGGAPRLSLVTCSGSWDGKAYSQRVVVDAALVA